MDLTLSSYGSCNYVSGHHSTIFYDEVRNSSLDSPHQDENLIFVLTLFRCQGILSCSITASTVPS